MAISQNDQKPDARWKDLYRVGGISSILIAAGVVFAIAAYFIWPYQDSSSAMEAIFRSLQTQPLAGFLSLDLVMLLIAPINLLMFLAIYAALKPINESYTLIALALILIAVILVIQSRPLVEMAVLSEKYSTASTNIEKTKYLAAGETLHAYFSGTAWTIQTFFFMIAGIIFSVMMLRSKFFSKITAWLGIFNSVVGMGFFLPTIGLPLLFLNTIATIPWCILVARDFFHLHQKIMSSLDPRK